MSDTETADAVRSHAQLLRVELNDLYSTLLAADRREAVPPVLARIRGVDTELEAYLQDHRAVLETEPDWSSYYALDRRIAARDHEPRTPELGDLAL